MTKSTMGTKLPRKLEQKMQIMVGPDQTGPSASEFQPRSGCRTCYLFTAYCRPDRERHTDGSNRYLSQSTLCASTGWWYPDACPGRCTGKGLAGFEFEKAREHLKKNKPWNDSLCLPILIGWRYPSWLESWAKNPFAARTVMDSVIVMTSSEVMTICSFVMTWTTIQVNNIWLPVKMYLAASHMLFPTDGDERYLIGGNRSWKGRETSCSSTFIIWLSYRDRRLFPYGRSPFSGILGRKVYQCERSSAHTAVGQYPWTDCRQLWNWKSEEEDQLPEQHWIA